MKRIVNFAKIISRNKLFAGSVVMLVGSLAGSFLNYLFHLFMGRQLGPEDYGVLASLISVNYLLSIPLGTLSLVVIKHISAWRGENSHPQINYFYNWLFRKMIVVGVISLLLILVSSPFIAHFLHLEAISLILLTGAAFVAGLYSLINTSVFQGFLRFDWVVITHLFGNLAKLGLSIFLVIAGWRVFGPIFSILISSLLSLLISQKLIKKLIKPRVEKINLDIKQIVTFFLPAFMMTLAMTSLYTLDVVLARHFLSHLEAGYYAALSTLGKIIFFATSPINSVMFPLLSEKHATGKDTRLVLGLGILLITTASIALSTVYFFFPKLMVSLLYGHDYLQIAGSLWEFGVFMGIYSVCTTLTNFHLSVKNYKYAIFPVAAASLQAGLIFIFHHNIIAIVRVSILSLFVLFIVLCLPLFKHRRLPLFRFHKIFGKVRLIR